MKKNKLTHPEPIHPDLKHATMEFAASVDGDDLIDLDDEEDEITAKELYSLESDKPGTKADALNSAAADSLIDEDNFLIVPDDIDELEKK